MRATSYQRESNKSLTKDFFHRPHNKHRDNITLSSFSSSLPPRAPDYFIIPSPRLRGVRKEGRVLAEIFLLFHARLLYATTTFGFATAAAAAAVVLAVVDGGARSCRSKPSIERNLPEEKHTGSETQQHAEATDCALLL